MNRLITKPIAPIRSKPIAETFEIVVNSVLSGFFNNVQTLVHCFVKDFKLNAIIEFIGLWGF